MQFDANARGRGRPRKITEEQLETARAMRDAGATDVEIGRRLGLDNSTIGRHLGPKPRREREWQHADGYFTVRPADDAERSYPTSHKNGAIRRSHLVWNRAHPEDLVQPGQHVHHINHIHDDDRIENLEKLTPAEHNARHHEERSELMRERNLERSRSAVYRAELAHRLRLVQASGRGYRPPPKLTPEQVCEIRARFDAGDVSKAQLGRDYGVSAVHIGRIVRGERWSEEAAAARRVDRQSKIEAILRSEADLSVFELD